MDRGTTGGILAAIALAALAGAQSATAQTQSNPFVLEGLVITASPTPRERASVAQHVTILEGRELEARGLVSFADALRGVPGIDVVRGGSFGAVTSVFLRGGESDYTLVLVDGVQVNQPGGGFDFASLDTRNIERVEIVRGPGSALYGSDAVTGVIHVITRMGRGGGTEGSIRFETGSYGERDGLVDGTVLSADLTGGSDRARYSVALGWDRADGVFPYNSGHERLSLSGAARFLPDDRTRVALTLRLQDREHRYPTDGAGRVVDRNSFYFSDETIAQLSAARALGSRLEVEALFGLSETDGGTDDAFDDPSDTESYSSLDHFRRTSAQIRSHLRVGPAVLSAGAEVEEERVRSFSESISSFGPFYGRSEDARSNLAGFAHATAEAGVFSINAGGRLEDNERFGGIGSWQVGVAAHLPERPATRLRAAAGSAIKEPTFVENFATGFAVGNPDLDPEWSLSWEVGLEHALADGAATVGITYFQQRFREMIQYTFLAAPGEPNYYNIAAARAGGVELDVALRLGVVDASANWTWLDTEVTDAGFDTGAGATFVEGEPLVRRPEHTLALSASAPIGARARVHTRVTRVGARQDRDFTTFPAEPVELEPYTLWTLGGDWDAQPAGGGRPRISLSVRAENLLGERYQEAFGFPAPRRQLYVGMSVGFGGAS